MKHMKYLSILLIISTLIALFATPAYADTKESSVEFKEEIFVKDLVIEQAELMTFEEMVENIAQKKGLTYESALETLPAHMKFNALRRDIMYLTKSVMLEVTDKYKPSLEFFCEVAAGGNFHNILSIYNVELNRASLTNSSMSKQFKGDIKVWLRSTQEIEYLINGDFYNNGNTSVSGGIGVNAGINELIEITFGVSIDYENNHYKYFYEHDFYRCGH